MWQVLRTRSSRRLGHVVNQLEVLTERLQMIDRRLVDLESLSRKELGHVAHLVGQVNHECKVLGEIGHRVEVLDELNHRLKFNLNTAAVEARRAAESAHNAHIDAGTVFALLTALERQVAKLDAKSQVLGDMPTA